MQLHSLVVAALAGAIGLVAGRTTRSDAPPVAPAPPPSCPAPPVAHAAPAPALEAEPEPEPEPDDGGEDVAAVLARARTRAAERRLEHDGIVGHVSDARDGSALSGVTVVVSSPALSGSQTAITDYYGNFSIYDLPAGAYTLNYYYSDITIERTGIAVSELDLTSITDSFDPSPPPPPPQPEWTISFSGEDGSENVYEVTE